MISASLVVDRQSHGLGLPPHHHSLHHHHHHHPNAHMTFDSSFLLPGPPSKPCSPPEFLRPLPKPAPMVQRYNGVSTTTSSSSHNSHHTPSSLNGCRVVTHSLAPRVSSKYQQEHTPVNLVKDAADAQPEEPPFTTPSSYRFPTQPYYPGPYGTLYPSHYNPLMARALFPPPQPPPPPNLVDSSTTFRHQSPPAPPASPGQFLSPPTPTFSPPQPPSSVKPGQSILLKRTFKVPSGKEGSLKHRILTRPAVIPPPNFTKGSLIQLSNGDLKRVEDMRTEDFVSSAEKSEALRLDPSTVVRIEEAQGNVLLTLSYGEHKSQVDFESSLEHPFFVFGHGWSSCSPERSLQQYGLKCHRLQVGDICISLTPRSPPPAGAPKATASDVDTSPPRKRRWSAPEQCHDDDEQPPKKT